MPARPEGSGIVIRRLPDIVWSVYCSRSYAEENGLPRSPEAIPGHAVIGAPPDATATNAAWLEEIAGEENVAVRCGSISSTLGSARAGLGLAVLPCFLAETAPELVQCMPPLPGMTSQVWMIVREDLKAAPHVRAFTDFLAKHIRDESARLSGHSRRDG
jgi:DNA-binding transcriptional LysR family regulator